MEILEKLPGHDEQSLICTASLFSVSEGAKKREPMVSVSNVKGTLLSSLLSVSALSASIWA